MSLPVGLAVALVAAQLLAPAARAQSQPTSWVKPTRVAFEIGDEPATASKSGEVNVPIPLMLPAGTKVKEIKLTLLDVRLGNLYVEGLADAFKVPEKVTVEPGQSSPVPIKVDLSKARYQGAYNLLIEATSPSQPSRELLDIQLNRPAAKLKGQPTLIVERVLMPFSEPEVSGFSMTLGVDGGHTRVTGLDITARNFTGDRGQAIHGTVRCPPPLPQLAPGGVEELPCQLEGDFPLGMSRGTVEVSAPQLAEAFPVNVEVRTRRAPGLILFIIALGLGAGYLLRTLLQQRLKASEVRLQAFALRDRMRAEADRRPDETLRGRIQAAVVKLDAARGARKPDDLPAAIVEADRELRESLKHFEDRRNKAGEHLDSFEKLVKTRWNLPAAARAMVVQAGSQIEGLRAELLRDNVKTVEDRLNNAGSVLAKNLGCALREWQNAQKITLELLDNRYLPDSVSAALSKDVDEAQALLVQAGDLHDDPALEKFSEALGAAHKARARVSNLYGKLRRWLQYEADEVVKALRRTTPPDVAAVEGLEKAAADFTKDLAALTEPEGAATLLTPERLSDLDSALRDAVEKQVAGSKFTGEKRAKLTPLLDVRKYAEAARAAYFIIEQKRRTMLSGARDRVEPEITSAAVSPPPADSGPAPEGPPVPLATPSCILRAEQIPGQVDPGISRTYSELLREKFLLFALSGLGIALVGYLLFEAKFVGTFADMAGIFLWAFGLDVTVDTVVRIAKGAEPRPGGS